MTEGKKSPKPIESSDSEKKYTSRVVKLAFSIAMLPYSSILKSTMKIMIPKVKIPTAFAVTIPTTKNAKTLGSFASANKKRPKIKGNK